MKSILSALVLIILLLSCKKSENPAVENESYKLEGRYIGTFHRTGLDTADVSILFNDNHFEGSSDKIKYPAICNGSFNIQGSVINFTDNCSWTADFDWSLILSGAFNFQVNNGAVKIWKVNGSVTDEYNLRKAIR